MDKPSESNTGNDASNSRKEKRKPFLTLSLLLHASLLAYWVFVHVHELSLMAIAATKIDAQHRMHKLLEFPGRWRFLTIVNMWLQLVFFCFSFIGHFLPSGRVQRSFKWLLDMMFTTIVFPTSFLIFSVFWPIYIVDSDSIYPSYLEKILPSYLNHLYHTGIVVTVLIELITVCHYYPGDLLGFFVMGSFNSAYLCVMLSSLYMLGRWPYRFMHKLSLPGLLTFFGISFLLYLAMYYIGKMLSHLRWGERLRLRRVKEE